MRAYVIDMILGSGISKEQRAKELEQKQYTDTHISNVKKVWSIMSTKNSIIEFICNEGQMMKSIVIPTIEAMVLSHDSSKYGIEEWEPYRKYYFPVDDMEKQSAQAEYEAALQHHYMHNMHHPEFWVNNKNDMPMTSVVEMCCDWIAVSMIKGGTALEFYNKYFNKDKLGEAQKEWVEFILKEYYK